MEAVAGETKKERGLAGQAQQALDIIIDDGTSVVFPDVVEQLRDDLITVGKPAGRRTAPTATRTRCRRKSKRRSKS